MKNKLYRLKPEFQVNGVKISGYTLDNGQEFEGKEHNGRFLIKIKKAFHEVDRNLFEELTQSDLGALFLKDLNASLHGELHKLFKEHINNGGLLEYSEKDYAYVSDDLDYIEVRYWGKSPDGDRQEEIAEEFKDNLFISDMEAFNILSTRLKNTLETLI